MIKARPFDYPFDGQFVPARTAVLAIDLQVDFLSQDGYFARKGYDTAPLRSVIGPIRQLTDAARRAGCLVIWTRQGYRADLADANEYDHWRARRAGIDMTRGDPGSLLRGSPGYQIVPELSPHDGDVIVDKTANGAFYQTDLELVLRARGITHLIFSGCTTDVCVHTTLREAVDRKYQCLLVEDACASGDAYAHAAALHMVTVEDGIFGVLATLADVQMALGALRPVAG
ncbi:MAG: cysteine hydrolase [Aquabacterium sp.]|nr:cysteine hydrolase [Aquabacterium sp.]